MYHITLKYFLLISLFCVCGCVTLKTPAEYQYKEIKTSAFTLASWVKQTDTKSPFRIYIEGDGRAYTKSGYPSANPTPHGMLMRKMAFEDNSPNVAYLARPCQFVKDDTCTPKDWTTERFSPRAVKSMAQAVNHITGGKTAQLYGYSGGALIGGLLIANYPQIKVTKWVTYAGLLNHTSWTKYHKLAPLTGSIDLEKLPDVPQTHYAGGKDKIIPPKLSILWTDNKNLVILPKSKHSGPFPKEK